MLTKTLDQIGDFNPQLFRELKGNLKPRNLILTGIITLILQVIITSMFYNKTTVEIEWEYLFRTLNYLIPLTAYLGGVYQLVSDLLKEQSRGTLNFIRLTPQSSYKILAGKILGVPSLVYLGILACIPLHLIAGISAEISIFWLLGMYTLWIAGGLFFSIISTFYTLLFGVQSNSNTITTSVNGLGCVITFMLGMPYLQLIDSSYQLYHEYNYGFGDLTWFLLPLGLIPLMAYLWLMISILTITYWFWDAVNRRFNNPNKTPLSKIQGYGLMTCFQLWLLGFVIPSYQGGITSEHFGVGLMFIFFLIPLVYLILMIAITPHRQTLLDWTRYRHKMNNHQDILSDLLIGEKSPAILAIAVNAIITSIIWLSWALLIPKENEFSLNEFTISEMTMALILTLSMGLIYAIIIQLSLLIKSNKRAEITILVLAIVMIFPVALGGIFATKSIDIALIWVFSPMPFFVFTSGGIFTALAGFFGQIGLLTWLTLTLTKRLKKAGKSETKSILSSH